MLRRNSPFRTVYVAFELSRELQCGKYHGTQTERSRSSPSNRSARDVII
jgi:hypothetical protein